VRFTTAFGEPRGGARIRGLFPNEPEVMAAVNSACVVWSARKDDKGNYVRLGQLPMTGPGGAACARSFGWVRPVHTGKLRGLVSFVLPLVAVPVVSVMIFVVYDLIRLMQANAKMFDKFVA
jgi:hypothetical protein